MKPDFRRAHVGAIALGCILVVSGCSSSEFGGSASPTAPSAAASPSPGAPAGPGATIQGTVTTAGTQAPSGLAPSTGPVSVSVAGSSISAGIDANGRFVLRGVPEGTVTLRFTGSGVDATLSVAAVTSTETVTLTLSISGNVAIVISMHREGGDESRVEGVIQDIDAGARRLVVAGRTIQVTDATEIRDAIARRVFGDLKRGDRIEVRGRADGSTLVAARIEITVAVDAPGRNPAPPPPAPGRDVEFTGSLTALSGRTPGATLTVAGRTVRTNANTVVRRRGDPVPFDRLQVGQIVEVDGTQQADGSVLASRITIEDEAEQEIEFEGTVSSINGSALGATLVVAGRIVRTTANTVIRRRGDQVPFDRLRVGQRVEVRGVLQSDGSVLADRITLEDD